MDVVPEASVVKVTFVPLALMIGAEGEVPWIVISFDAVRVVPAGAAGLPPVAVAVTVSVSVTSLCGRLLTVTTPEVLLTVA